MLFEDLDTLNEVIDLIRAGGDNRSVSSGAKDHTKVTRRYRDLNVSMSLFFLSRMRLFLMRICGMMWSQDPEIDRLYSTSPPEFEQVGTFFELDDGLLSDFHSVSV